MDAGSSESLAIKIRSAIADRLSDISSDQTAVTHPTVVLPPILLANL
jgi:hypothetical protein